MHIDVTPPETWENLGEEIETQFRGQIFPNSSQVQVRTYRGAGHAAYEASQILLQIYSHKRNIGYIKGTSHIFEFLIPQFLKNALQLQGQDHAGLTDVKAWVEQLKKDTNFVMLTEDHPVTGEVYPFEALDEALNEKKIFCLRVSHARHLQTPEDVRPYSARILSFGPDLGLTLFGLKLKALGIVSPQMGWDRVATLQKIQRKRKRVFDRSLVEQFESQFESFKFFKTASNRLFDRAVLVFPDISADALLHEIAEVMSINNAHELLSTPNQCSWADPVSFSKWWQPQPSLESLRGLLVFSTELLTRKDFASLVKSSYDRIKSQQESFL